MTSSSTVTLTGNQGASGGTPGDGATGTALVLLSGNTDVYTGGDASTVVSGTTNNSIVTLGNGQDVVSLTGNGNIVTLGSAGGATASPFGGGCGFLGFGHAPVMPDQVLLQGSNNSVTTSVSANITLTGTGNSTSLIDASGSGAGQVQVNVTLSGTGDHVTQSGAGNGMLNVQGNGGGNYVNVADSGSIVLGGQQNTVIVTGGSHWISAGSGQDYVTLGGSGTQMVQLAGQSDQVSGTGHAVITGGSGGAALTLGLAAGGDSAYAVALGGTSNSISVGTAGSGTHGWVAIDAGSGNDTVSLAGAAGSAVFHGSGNMLFLASLGSDAPLAVTDAGSGLTVTIASAGPLGGSAPLTLYGFDQAGVIDFKPGVFGFGSVSQVMADLHSDGMGGSVLSLPGTSAQGTAVIHFVGDNHLTAANFAVG